MTTPARITFVLTSCGRFDLLAETLASFLACNTAPIERYVVVEDSGEAGVHDVLRAIGASVELLFNDPPLGQMRSIERAYATIATPYVFHCEDDWRFFRKGFVEESQTVLDADPAVSAVLCRSLGQSPTHDLLVQGAPLRHAAGVAYRQPALGVHRVWGGYSFNPGLRRLADWQRLRPAGGWAHESEASLAFKQAGMGLAMLEEPACETSGQARHVRDPFAPADWRPRALGSLATAVPMVGRNEPCPCGSGERYKNCHGRLGG